MIYYKLFGKKVLLTVHNVNAGVRDFSDTQLNRLTLRIQYHLADHLFVHTERRMKSDLTTDFGVPATRITVIPFGVDDAGLRTLASHLRKLVTDWASENMRRSYFFSVISRLTKDLSISLLSSKIS